MAANPNDTEVISNGTLCFDNGNHTCDNNTAIIHETGRLLVTPEAFVVPCVFALIFLVGIVGNGTLIYTVVRNKNMRNVPNIFIVSLALGDLVLILVSVPFTATIYTFAEWPYGGTMCKLNEFFQALSLGVSVFTLTALSGDRYMAIVDPMKRHRGSPTMRTLIIAVSLWLLSLVMALLEAVATHIKHERNPESNVVLEVCQTHPEAWGEDYEKFHVVFRFLVYFAIPVTIIGFFYMQMASVLVQSSRHMPGEGQAKATQYQKQMEARKKVAKVVLSFVIVFIICWLPRHIYVMWYYFDPNEYNMFWHVFKILGFCLSFINSCVNPLALYFLSKQFRRYYNRYLCCLWVRRPRSDSEYSTMYNFNSTVRRTSTTMTMLPSNTKTVLLKEPGEQTVC